MYSETIEDMVNFLSSFPVVAKRGCTLNVFLLCFLFLSHVCPLLPSVRHGSSMPGEVDLSARIELLQSNLLSSQMSRFFSTDLDSITKSIKIIDNLVYCVGVSVYIDKF